MMARYTKMSPREFCYKFNKLQDKTCSKLIAQVQSEDSVYIYRVRENGHFDLFDLFAYSTSYGYWAFTNQTEDRILVTPKTLKLMAKFIKPTYKSARK